MNFRNIFYFFFFFSLEKDICMANEKYIGCVVQFIKYDITIITNILKIYI